MKKYMIAFIIVIGLLLPKYAVAELDFIKDFIGGVEIGEENVSLYVNDNVKGQVNLQEKTTDTKNQKKAKSLARTAIQVLNGSQKARKFIDTGDYSEFFNTKISNLQWPGIDAATDCGEYTSPMTKRQVLMSYFKKKHVDNDVQVSVAKDVAMNNLAIENLAIDYANALVTRRQLQEESKKLSTPDEQRGDKDAKNSGKDIMELEWNYGVVMRRANNRWLNILLFESSHISNILKERANKVRLDDTADVLGEKTEETVEQLKEHGVRTPQYGSNGITIGNVENLVNKGIDAVKRKDYSSAFNSMAGIYSGSPAYNPEVAKTINKVSSKVEAGQRAYNNADNKNYDALSEQVFVEGQKYYKQQKDKNNKEKADDKTDANNGQK